MILAKIWVPDHDDTVSAQERIDERLSEKHAVRHITDSCPVFVADIFKANSITDLEAFGVNGNHVTSQVVHLLPKN